MTFRLSILLGACCLFPLSCQEEKKSAKATPPKEVEKKEVESTTRKKSLISIPAGAVISDLTLPYFDDENKRISLLTIKELTVNEDQRVIDGTYLSGSTLKLWLFDKDGRIQTTTTIPTADYRVEKELIEAKGQIFMRGAQDKFAAKSNGGTFALATGQALLLGPATTRFDIPKKEPKKNTKKDSTTMNLRPLIPITGMATMLVAAPPEISPEQLADFERKVAPRIIPHLDGEENFKKAETLNQQVTQRLSSFLGSVDQTILISNENEPVLPDDKEDPLQDLFKPGPEAIVITSSKGIYLDGENREIVYLGDVKIQGQGLTMTSKRDLKAIFNPPAEKPKSDKDKETADDKKKKENPLSKFGGFGDLKQFTATGDVRISGVNPDGQKVYLGGDRALYEMTKDGEKIDSTVTLRGDKLAFMLGDPNDPKNKEGVVALRSVSPNAWVVAEIKNETIKARFSDNGWQTVVISPDKKGE